MTTRGKKFTELVFDFTHGDESKREEILEILSTLTRGLDDSNDVLNRLGNFNCPSGGEYKVSLSKNLVMYANYELTAHCLYTQDKSFYEEEILTILIKVTDGRSLEECYHSMGELIK